MTDSEQDNVSQIEKPAKWDEIYESILEDTGDKEKAAAIATSRAGSRYGKAKDDPKTPAKPSERREGSDQNKPESASGSRGGIKLSEANVKGLEGKRDSHNEKYKGTPSKRVNLGQLKAVFRRGAGAFSTSHRPSVTSRDQWAMARVNAFLHLMGTGKPKNAKYTTDNDLLPASHSRSTKKSQIEKQDSISIAAPDGYHWMNYEGGPVLMVGDYQPHESASADFTFELITEHDPDRIKKYGTPDPEFGQHDPLTKQETYKPPKGVQEAARRGLELRREHGRGGTEVGVARARNLSNGDNVPLATIRRMVSFFARHEVDLKAPKNSDRSHPEYPGAGLIAWKLWGGSAGKTWADSISERNKKSYSEKQNPSVINLLALSQIRPSTLAQMDEADLAEVWEYLSNLFSQFKTDPMIRGRIIAAASRAVEEIQSRKVVLKASELHRESQRLIDSHKSQIEALNKTGVPIWNPGGSVVFVVSEANEIDKARGEFLSGPDGRAFKDLYLDRLKLRKSDVCILDVSQIDWIEKSNPIAVIALGRTSKKALGEIANCNLPHPKAVRRFGDSGEINRKLRSISKNLSSHIENLSLDAMTTYDRYLETATKNSVDRSEMIDKSRNETDAQVEDIEARSDSQIETRGDSGQIDSGKSETQELKSLQVPILKADSEKQIVYGVVLDPYVIDGQQDWTSPKAIEDTAHEWLATSRIIGFDHKEKADAYPVESSIIPYPSNEDYQNAIQNKPHKAYRMPFGDDVVHSGSWVLGTKVADSIWDKVKSGELNAYSIGGYGKREEMSQNEMPEVEFLELAEDR